MAVLVALGLTAQAVVAVAATSVVERAALVVWAVPELSTQLQQAGPQDLAAAVVAVLALRDRVVLPVLAVQPLCMVAVVVDLAAPAKLAQMLVLALKA
jgi:hypothetical protein